MDLEDSRLWGNWEKAARLTNNTQTAVAVTGLKAALVIGEMCDVIQGISGFWNAFHSFRVIHGFLSIGFISHEDQQDISNDKGPRKKKSKHQTFPKDSDLDTFEAADCDAEGSRGVVKDDIKKKRIIFKESRYMNMSY